MSELKVSIIGAGNLGSALARGLVESGAKPSNIYATRRNISKLQNLKTLGINIGSDNVKAVKNTNIVILAVKPFNFEPVLAEISHEIENGRQLVISVITGVDTARLSHGLPEGITILRAMPNTAADVKESLTCICHQGAERQSVDTVMGIFNALGHTVEINEELMDAATVLGACGIAYVMRFIRAMVQGGIEIGFDAATASTIVQQTVKGAASLLQDRDSHPESEIDKVTTPKGCTIAGLNEMEHNGFSSALIKGLKASMAQIGS